MHAPPARDDAFALRGLLGLGLVAGVLSTVPGLSVLFWFGHPWLTVPLFLRARTASVAGLSMGVVTGRSALAGLASGAVVGAGIAVVEQLRTGATLPLADLFAHGVYPVVALVYAVTAAAVGHRFGARSRPTDVR